MKALRSNLQCKSFDWFLKNVYPEGIITDITDVAAMGEIRNPGTGRCLDTLHNANWDQPMGLYGCHGQGGSQAFVYLHKTSEIRPVENLELCLTSDLAMSSCEHRQNAKWELTSGILYFNNHHVVFGVCEWVVGGGWWVVGGGWCGCLRPGKQLRNTHSQTCMALAGNNLAMVACSGAPEQVPCGSFHSPNGSYGSFLSEKVPPRPLRWGGAFRSFGRSSFVVVPAYDLWQSMYFL
jgi:hypothetical protein